MVLCASNISTLEKNVAKEQLFCILGCLLNSYKISVMVVLGQNRITGFMVLDDLLGSKMTNNQAHISLEIRIQVQPLRLTQQSELPKRLLVFMKTPVE